MTHPLRSRLSLSHVMMQRRKQPRQPVECLATVAGYRAHQDALVTDLSLDGLQVTTAHPVPKGTPLLLHVSLPDDGDEALEVQLANVQWVREQQVGLKIVIISPRNKERLGRFLHSAHDVPIPQGSGGGKQGGGDLAPLTSTLQLKVSDVLLFVNWMNEAHRACQFNQPLPQVPVLESPQVKAWVELVQMSAEQFRQSETKTVSLLAHVSAQETQLERLVHQLHESIASLYDNLGRTEKAEEIRKLSSALQITHS